MQTINLAGEWTLTLPDGTVQPVRLPATLDENAVGGPDTGEDQWHPDANLGKDQAFLDKGVILTRLTRKHVYEGPAEYSRTFKLDNASGLRTFLEVERTRKLACAVNGRPVSAYHEGTLSTPYVYEITPAVWPGENACTLRCDNSYPGWPRKAILASSAATNETQTNWNGLLGTLRLRMERPCFIDAVRVYPGAEGADAAIDLDCATPWEGTVRLHSDALAQPASRAVTLAPGRHTLRFGRLPWHASALRWDTDEGNLHTLTAQADGMADKQASFGIRTFGSRDGRLVINGRVVFLRSEANCCVFPQTGHMPLDVPSWREILAIYQSYGVNCMRFHSHCPPDAAFTAADQLGMLMQPELSHWDPQMAFGDAESWRYYRMELQQILRAYANHPSFVMFTFGNELHTGEDGQARMIRLLEEARALDATRLYANGSNTHYGQRGADPHSDFYTSSAYFDAYIRGTSAGMRGYINECPPNTRTDFDAEMRRVRADYDRPVFSFEVGQYEVLPDFDELSDYTGITCPDNLRAIETNAREKGFLPDWNRRVEATGELALLAYREEIEAVARTEGLSGISLLGLQDFPGQGTALVGMLGSHLRPKPYAFAQPGRFRAFFADVLVLALMDTYTYTSGETLRAQVKVANYGKCDLEDGCTVELLDERGVLQQVALAPRRAARGGLTTLGTATFGLSALTAPQRLTLRARVGGHASEYPIWVYPDAPVEVPDGVLVTQSSAEARAALAAGGTVFLSPPATEAHLPGSIQAQFTTDFWSVGTFPFQSGFMGCLVDPAHPALAGFPTAFHADWQWWPLCQGRAMVLPEGLEPIVAGIDCYARMRRLGLLLEARVGPGRLMLCSMGLLECQDAPPARALLRSVLGYMAGSQFSPSRSLGMDMPFVCADDMV